MSDPARFRDGGGGELERLVIESVRDEAPSPRTRRRVEAALGLGAATAISTTATTSALGASIKAGATLVVSKWIAVAAITVVAGVGAATYLKHETRLREGTQPAPSAMRAQPIASSVASGQRAMPAIPARAAIPAARSAEPSPSAERPMAPTAAAVPSIPSAMHTLTVGDELRLLDDAHAALSAGDTDRAMALLDRHDREASKPAALAPEALALRAEVCARTGDRTSAARIAKQFLATYGSWPEAQRMRTLLEEATRDPTNP
jgi:hypothetical protein